MHSTIVLHANLQHAEIPVDHISQVIQKSYIPVLSSLLEIPKAEVVLNFTGVTLDILYNEFPEVLDLLREGIKNNKFELTGCGYSHPIFPLLPVEDMKKQIEFNQKIFEKALNYTPKGFWLPELAYDPLLPMLLKEYGYSYTFIDDELYNLSSPLLNDSNPYNNTYYSASHYIVDFLKTKGLLRKLTRYRNTMKNIKKISKKTNFYPVELKGARGTITGLKIPQSWSIITSAALLGFPYISLKKLIKLISNYKNQKGLIIPYGNDIEFFGYRSFVKGKLMTEKDLKKFLSQLISIKGNQMILPINYLKDNRPSELGYLKTGSWAPDRRLDVWLRDEDNQRLERLLDEVRRYLVCINPEDIGDELWKHILLAENSDGRGWNSLPERRLDCFANVLDALRIAKEKSLKKRKKS